MSESCEEVREREMCEMCGMSTRERASQTRRKSRGLVGGTNSREGVHGDVGDVGVGRGVEQSPGVRVEHEDGGDDIEGIEVDRSLRNIGGVE